MSDYPSNPIIRTYGGAELFLKRHREIAECKDKYRTCYRGHVKCSTDEGGPCLDETLANFSRPETWEDRS